ncbi:MAG: MBL fold metallo-hydrolase [Bacteroidales bacterium]|nr:MBL fold metallo-hydrolase [Bacteroidales bacterium]
MKLTFLGTGTSVGVPQMRCSCSTCTSADPRDKRMRCSAMVQMAPDTPAILIDCGPDFRMQMLGHGSPDLACALLTHTHYDHVGGIDDLRPYCYEFPDHHFPLFCQPNVATDLRNRIPYCFAKVLYPGVPTFKITEIERDAFMVDVPGYGPVEVIPLPVMHGKIHIVGYRIGPLAYITDCSEMPPAITLERLRGVDTLVVNALRALPHPSHMTLDQALEVIAAVGPRQAYLTHMSHDTPPHAQAELALPPGVHYAYDGLTIFIDDPDRRTTGQRG